MRLLEGDQRSVLQTVELDEDVVPDLDDLRMVLVDELSTRELGSLLFGSAVDVYLAAGTAGAGVAHLPEIILLLAEDDAVFGQDLAPLGEGDAGGGEAFGGVALEDRRVETVAGDAVDLGQQLTAPFDGLLLEVVAESPVAQHLEHRVVVGVDADLFQVVVLATHAQAFLGVGHTGVRGFFVPQEIVLEGVHAGIGEEKRGVVLHHDRGRWHDMVALGCEKIEELPADVG